MKQIDVHKVLSYLGCTPEWFSQHGYAVIPVDPESLERGANAMRHWDERMFGVAHRTVRYRQSLRAALEALGVQTEGT